MSEHYYRVTDPVIGGRTQLRKLGFPSQYEAEVFLAWREHEIRRPVECWSIYQCKHCGLWHTGHPPRRNKQGYRSEWTPEERKLHWHRVRLYWTIWRFTKIKRLAQE
jgi:hypothetical protein